MKKKQIILMSTLIPVAAAGIACAIALPIVLNRKPVEPVPPGPTPIVVTENDKKLIAEINDDIAGKTYNTMSELLAALLLNGAINLQTQTLETNGVQFVWDSQVNTNGQQTIFLMDNDGKVAYAPEGYTINQDKSKLWKMVGSPKTQLRSASRNTAQIDAFDGTSTYSQFIRDDAELPTTVTFCSGLDTGIHTKLDLVFNKSTGSEEPVVINTLQSKLTVESEISDVHHYGNLSELVVNELPANNGTYAEFGTVDARVVLKDGTLEAKTGSTINDIVIESNDVKGVELEADSNVGTVYTTEGVTKKASQLVDDSAVEEEKKPVKEDTPVDPAQETRYYGGRGTKEYPYVLSTKQQLINAQIEVNEGFEDETNEKTPNPTACFRLLNNIDLENTTWTPIGSKDNPFKGNFEGNGFTISNFTVAQTSGKSYAGFFGYVCGTKNNTRFNDFGKVWKDSEKRVLTENVSPEDYDISITNLTIDHETNNLNVGATGANEKYVGGLAGKINGAYLYNIHIKNSVISGSKYVGGIAGATSNAPLIYASTDANTTVSSNYWNCAGIVGSLGNGPTWGSEKAGDLLMYCDNYATVTCNATTIDGVGNVSGITAMAQDGTSIGVIANCNNYGHIVTKAKNPDKPTSAVCPSGISSNCISLYVCVDTNNYGEIEIADGYTAPRAAGIVSYGAPKIVNCQNHGYVHGNASEYMAGIIAYGYSQLEGFALELDNIANFGEIKLAPGATGEAGGVCAGAPNVPISGGTFATVADLQTAIFGTKEPSSVDLTNVTVTNTTGTLQLPACVRSFTSNTKVCDNIEIKTGNPSISIDIPDTKITFKNSIDTSATLLYSWGKNNTITVNQGATVRGITVGGQNSTVINNGTITGGLTIGHLAIEATNTGSIGGGVHFNNDKRGTVPGASTKKFTNAATGSVTSTFHTISAGGDCAVTIDNYGIIDNKATGFASYLFLWYNDAVNVINNYAGSKWTINDVGNPIAGPYQTFTINYETGATYFKDNVEKTFESLAWSRVIVNHKDPI